MREARVFQSSRYDPKEILEEEQRRAVLPRKTHFQIKNKLFSVSFGDKNSIVIVKTVSENVFPEAVF